MTENCRQPFCLTLKFNVALLLTLMIIGIAALNSISSSLSVTPIVLFRKTKAESEVKYLHKGLRKLSWYQIQREDLFHQWQEDSLELSVDFAIYLSIWKHPFFHVQSNARVALNLLLRFQSNGNLL